MRVLVTSAYTDPEPIGSFRKAIARDRFRQHELVDDAEAADIILFIENAHDTDDPSYRQLRAHPWVSRYAEKVFLYSGNDRPWCVLPGIYMSMRRRHFDRTRVRSGRYARMLNPYVEQAAVGVEPDLLFSFVGAPRLRVRERILALRHPNAVLESSAGFNPFRLAGQQDEARWSSYARIMARSRFVLCPRGAGTASIRVFEALSASRVPVILADGWVPPDGPNWEECAIFVRERDAATLPALLEGRNAEWPQMARAARAAWDEYFCDEVLLQRTVEACQAILNDRRIPERLRQRLPSFARLEHTTRSQLGRLRRATQTYLGTLVPRAR